MSLLPILTVFALQQPQLPVVEWRPVEQFRNMVTAAMAYDPGRQRLVLFGGTGVGGDLNETWEWDGRAWHLRRPSHHPPLGCYAGRLAYDPNRKRMILFGGLGPKNSQGIRAALDEMWEWDGRDWTRLQPKNMPPARFLHSMATDPLRKRIVLFGGYNAPGSWINRQANLLGDTWEWDGLDWKQVFPKNSPSPRGQPGLAWHANRKTVMLWSGVDGVGWALDLKNLYEWNGSDWGVTALSTGPPDASCVICPDPMTGNVLLQSTGKTVGTGSLWSWDGKSWIKQADTPHFTKSWIAPYPPVPYVVAMGWGEETINGVRHELRATMVWDGKAWKAAERAEPVEGQSIRVAYFPEHEKMLTQPQPSSGLPLTSPMGLEWYSPEELWSKVQVANPIPFRLGAGMAYHPGLGKVLVWGGYAQTGATTEAWLFDGRSWTFHSKGPRPGLGVAWDSDRKQLLGFDRDTLYVFDEKTGWKKMGEIGTKPFGLYWSLAHDPVRKVTVAYGGSKDTASSTNVPLGETWEWDGKAWTKRNPKTVPPIRIQQHTLYVPELGGVVLLGGVLSPYHTEAARDTWLWDGSDWREIKTEGSYIQISLFNNSTATWEPQAAVYDPHRQRILAFNLRDQYLAYEMRVRNMEATQDYPHPGEAFAFDVALPGEAGRPFLFLFSGSTGPGIPLRIDPSGQVQMLPLGIDPLLVFSLSGPIWTILDGQGKGRIPFRIPADNSLLWFRFHAAGVCIGPQLQFTRITNRVDVEVVPK